MTGWTSSITSKSSATTNGKASTRSSASLREAERAVVLRLTAIRPVSGVRGGPAPWNQTPSTTLEVVKHKPPKQGCVDSGQTDDVTYTRQLQLLVEGVIDYAIYMISPEGLVVTWNPGAE